MHAEIILALAVVTACAVCMNSKVCDATARKVAHAWKAMNNQEKGR